MVENIIINYDEYSWWQILLLITMNIHGGVNIIIRDNLSL